MKYFTLKVTIKANESVSEDDITEKVFRCLKPHFTDNEEVWNAYVESWSSDRLEDDGITETWSSDRVDTDDEIVMFGPDDVPFFLKKQAE